MEFLDGAFRKSTISWAHIARLLCGALLEDGTMKKSALFLASFAFILLGGNAWADFSYNITDLGTLGYASYAYSINDSGQVVGWSNMIGQNGLYIQRAVLFQPGIGIVDLGSLTPTHPSAALSISNNGQIVGWGGSQALIFDPTGKGNNTALGRGGAFEVNENGEIVGWSHTASGDIHATLFDTTGGGDNIDLGTCGGDVSFAYSINNNGETVGVSHGSGGGATLFDPTGNIKLDTGEAFSINNHGQIVGYQESTSGCPQASIFNPYGTTIHLGTLGGRESVARHINDNGDIVGWAYDVSGATCPTLFDSTGAGINIDLNTLIDPMSGWSLEYAEGINNNGWIVGRGVNPDGFGHAYLLTPVPVPSAVLLGTLGLSVAGWKMRRREKS